jgi:LDH2 family malate/lactate/ureidoglycolate dehydrogenase
MTQLADRRASTVRVSYSDLLGFGTDVFVLLGVPRARAATAATALCYGDLTGMASHGLVNLARLYLPLFRGGRVDPTAEPELLTDLGACALLDSRRALGLWAAAEAMDSAVERAEQYGVGLVSMREATHFGCAGHHAARAAERGMIGMLAGNCGRQRIAPPPGGALTMLGTNPLSVAAPAGPHHPFVLDMSTTVVPTGRIRAAERHGEPIPPGWLDDTSGKPVTDPAAFDRGQARLRWLGGEPHTGAYKGFGLGLAVEVLAALLPGAGLGPSAEALDGDGRPGGRDDDIGVLAMAIAPGMLRPRGDFVAEARALFETVLGCPPVCEGEPVRYPGWIEAERAAAHLRDGVPLQGNCYAELCEIARQLRLPAPPVRE